MIDGPAHAGERWLKGLATLLGLMLILGALAASFPKLPGLPALYLSEEVVKPIGFAGFITVLTLRTGFSAQRLRGGGGGLARAALVDGLTIATVLAFAATYVLEVSIEKPDVFPAWLGARADPMVRLLEGPPAWTVALAVWTAFVLLALNLRHWGLPLVLVALFAVGYALLAALSSAFGWAPGNVFLSYDLAARDPLGELWKFLIVGDTQSILGQFASILLRVVLPFLLLGSLFAATGGGGSLIKLAFVLTRRTRAGPAFAAIGASSLFGTISGGPIVNVLSTGVLTVPMMLRRGFRPGFAGAVEASASTGGQIVPPVMGITAFFLANFTGTPYGLVLVAALVPAALYYLSLFLTVALEARKAGMAAGGELPPELVMTRQDWWNLSIVFGPLAVIVTILASEAFTVAAAGIFALIALLLLAPIDPDVRARPWCLIEACVDAAVNVGKIIVLFCAVALVDSALNAVGFPTSFGALVSDVVTGRTAVFGIPAGEGVILLFALAMTALAALALGMGMPTLPAYANVAIVMAPALAGLGVSVLTANMFVFYFAVASSITPPMALAAFAAASLTKADPMRTGFIALRISFPIFIVPFVFAFYPEILVIEDAFIADALSGTMIESRPLGFDPGALASILPRLMLAIYLLATAMAAIDRTRLSGTEIGLRCFIGLAVLMVHPLVHVPAVVLALAMLVWHRKGKRGAAAAQPS